MNESKYEDLPEDEYATVTDFNSRYNYEEVMKELKHTLPKKIILVGKSGSGKDYIKNLFEKRGYKCGISDTTRPIRDYEQDGIDYNFISKEDFKSKKYIESCEFNGWMYGTTFETFNSSEVLIMSPEGVKNLSPVKKTIIYVVYIMADDSIRMNRLKKRKDDEEEIKRRMKSDEKDFKNFKKFDMILINQDDELDDEMKITKIINYSG